MTIAPNDFVHLHTHSELAFSTGSAGSPTSSTRQAADPAGRSVSYGYDGLGQLTSVTDAGGAAHTYAYSDGSLTGRTDANGHTSQEGYDASGRV